MRLDHPFLLLPRILSALRRCRKVVSRRLSHPPPSHAPSRSADEQFPQSISQNVSTSSDTDSARWLRHSARYRGVSTERRGRRRIFGISRFKNQSTVAVMPSSGRRLPQGLVGNHIPRNVWRVAGIVRGKQNVDGRGLGWSVAQAPRGPRRKARVEFHAPTVCCRTATSQPAPGPRLYLANSAA